MKKIVYLTAVLALFACSKNNQEPSQPQPEPQEEENYPVTVPAFAKGADVSWLSEMEHNKKTFVKKDGTKADCFEVLKDCGVNAIRLRVWVNPYGGWSGKEDMAALALRAVKAGLPVMVDFHYSDFFCDPARQTPPEAWMADISDVNKMAAHVAEHTEEVLTFLKDKGVTPSWIQIGNETRNGMLWPLGKLWGDGAGGWVNFAKLYMAGYDAAKKVVPDAKVMPHLPNAFSDNNWWLDALLEQKGKFDMIALSHYPQAGSKENGVVLDADACNALALERIAALAKRTPVMVSEVGVKTNNNENEAKRVLAAFMTGVKGISNVKGVFYWEPEVYDWWKPSVYNDAAAIYKYTGKRETWGSYDSGAFLTGGRPSSVMSVFAN